jgi:ABC-type Fe3+/spermidine/putrescine transport system ATPase subunit
MGPEAEAAGVPLLEARVVGETYQGAMLRYRLDLAGQEMVAERQNQAHLDRWDPGATVKIGWTPERARLLPAE